MDIFLLECCGRCSGSCASPYPSAAFFSAGCMPTMYQRCTHHQMCIAQCFVGVSISLPRSHPSPSRWIPIYPNSARNYIMIDPFHSSFFLSLLQSKLPSKLTHTSSAVKPRIRVSHLDECSVPLCESVQVSFISNVSSML